MTEEERRNDSKILELEGRVRTLEMSISERLTRLESKVEALTEAVKEFVTNARFTPVQILVYGLVSIVMGGFFTAILLKVMPR